MFFFITAKNMGSHFSAVPLCRPSSGLKRSVLIDPLENYMTDLFPPDPFVCIELYLKLSHISKFYFTVVLSRFKDYCSD